MAVITDNDIVSMRIYFSDLIAKLKAIGFEEDDKKCLALSWVYYGENSEIQIEFQNHEGEVLIIGWEGEYCDNGAVNDFMIKDSPVKINPKDLFNVIFQNLIGIIKISQYMRVI